MQAERSEHDTHGNKKRKKPHKSDRLAIAPDQSIHEKRSKKRKRDGTEDHIPPQLHCDAEDALQAERMLDRAARKKRKKEAKAARAAASGVLSSEQLAAAIETTNVPLPQVEDTGAQIDPALLDDSSITKEKMKMKNKDKGRAQETGQDQVMDEPRPEEHHPDIIPDEPSKKKKKKKKKDKKGSEPADSVPQDERSQTLPSSGVDVHPSSLNNADMANLVSTTANSSSMAFLAAIMSALNGQTDPLAYPPPSANMASYAARNFSFGLDHGPGHEAGSSSHLQHPSAAQHLPDPNMSDVFFNELAANMQAMGVNGDMTDPTKILNLLRNLGVSNPGAAMLSSSQPIATTLADNHLAQPSSSRNERRSHPGGIRSHSEREQLAVEAAMAPTPIGQKPVTADQLRSVREGDGITAAPVAVSVGAARTTRRDHQHMLATKWMKASDLNDMVTREGLIYKKGKFSAIEDAQLRVAKENYRLRHSLTNEEVDELIFSKDKKRDVGFWQELTMAVPQRPLNAVYHHVRRITHPLKKMGKWMPEEDVRLTQAVMQHGPQWEIVSMQVGRMASDCRDRWRNHLMEKDKRKMGQWSKDEEEELKRIVTELAQLQGKSVEESDTDVFWTKVSERMDYKRSRQQCRGKWTDVLSKTVKTTDPTRRWSQQDAYILIRKVDSLNIRHDTEIDWKTLIDPSWNLFSAHSLQRRWGTMKKSIKGWEQMTHAEIMDILRQKKGQPPPPSRRQERRKITSAAIINDDEDVVDDMSPTPDRAVGSSTGPGTLAGQHAQYEQDVVTTTTAEVPSARPATVAKKSPKPKLKPKKKLASATPSLVIKDYRTSAVAAPPEVLDSSSDESDSDD